MVFYINDGTYSTSEDLVMLSRSRQWALRNAFLLGMVLGIIPVFGWILAAMMAHDASGHWTRTKRSLWSEESESRPSGFYALGLWSGSVTSIVAVVAIIALHVVALQ